MENEEEKNELFTLLCYELHFWHRGILNVTLHQHLLPERLNNIRNTH